MKVNCLSFRLLNQRFNKGSPGCEPRTAEEGSQVLFCKTDMAALSKKKNKTSFCLYVLILQVNPAPLLSYMKHCWTFCSWWGSVNILNGFYFGVGIVDDIWRLFSKALEKKKNPRCLKDAGLKLMTVTVPSLHVHHHRSSLTHDSKAQS